MSVQAELFPRSQYPNLAQFHQYCRKSGLIETGSSSIDPAYAESCTEIRNLMATHCGIGQINAGNNDLWASLGDPSGILYFGGRRHGVRVTAAEYLEHLAAVMPALSEKALAQLEELAGTFYRMTQFKPEDMREVDLDF